MKNLYKNSLVIILLLLTWQLFYFVSDSENFLLSSPGKIIQVLFNLVYTGEVFNHIGNSLQRVLVGFGLATVLGVFLGLLLGDNRKVGEYFLPIIEILRPIPPIAWIPIAILIFGLGNTSAYFVVFLGSFFPIFTNTYFGAASMPQIYRNVQASFELSRFVYFKDILFKYSLPHIMAGLKIGIGLAWVCVIAAEMIGAQSGLGYFIQINRLLLHTDKMFAGIVLIGLLGFFLNMSIKKVEKVVIKWKE